MGSVHRYSELCPHVDGVIHENDGGKGSDCPVHRRWFSTDGVQVMGRAKTVWREVRSRKTIKLSLEDDPVSRHSMRTVFFTMQLGGLKSYLPRSPLQLRLVLAVSLGETHGWLSILRTNQKVACRVDADKALGLSSSNNGRSHRFPLTATSCCSRSFCAPFLNSYLDSSQR